MNDLSAEGETHRQLMEVDVQLQRMEGGGEAGRQTDRRKRNSHFVFLCRVWLRPDT